MHKPKHTSETGKAAEELACVYLQNRGLVLINRNYRCRIGEIDLVMLHDTSIVFIEVRYRRSRRFGSAAESVDRRKQARIISAARYYLHLHRAMSRRSIRFDVVLVEPGWPVDWIMDAFQTC